MSFPGVASQTVIVPSTSRTALYVIDVRPTQVNARRVVFQVSVPDCMTYVCGLCIFAPGTLDQYGKLICFDVSSVTQNVTIIVPDQPEIILGGCTPPSIVTLGPEGQTPDCYDAHTLEDAVGIAATKTSPIIKVYPGTYETVPVTINNLDLKIIGVSGGVLFVPMFPVAAQTILVEITNSSVFMSNLKFDVTGVIVDGTFENILKFLNSEVSMENIDFVGSDNFDGSAHVDVSQCTTVNVKECSFDQGGVVTSLLTDMPRHGLMVSSQNLIVENCTVGSDDITKSRFSIGAINISSQSVDDRTVVAAVKNTTAQASVDECMQVSIGHLACVWVSECVFQNSENGPGVLIKQNDTAPSFVPGNINLSSCKFSDVNKKSIEVENPKIPIQRVITNCFFDEKHIEDGGPKYGITSLQNQNVPSANALSVRAPVINVGDSMGQETVFLGGGSTVPTYVFRELNGTFGSNIVDTITSSKRNASPDSVQILTSKNDTLWVGFSEGMIGLFYNILVEDQVLEASACVTTNPMTMFPPVSRFVYDTSLTPIENSTFPALMQGSAYATPISDTVPVSGTVNGVFANAWVVMRRISDAGTGMTINSLRGVGCTFSYRAGRNALQLGCSSMTSLVTTQDFDQIDLGGGNPPIRSVWTSPTQRVRTRALRGNGTGNQGIGANFVLDRSFTKDREISVVYIIAVIGANSSTAELQMQMSILQSPIGNNVVTTTSGSAVIPELYFDSGMLPVGANSQNRTMEMVFAIPAKTFVQAPSYIDYPMISTVLIRNAAVDGDPVDLDVISMGVRYQYY